MVKSTQSIQTAFCFFARGFHLKMFHDDMITPARLEYSVFNDTLFKKACTNEDCLSLIKNIKKITKLQSQRTSLKIDATLRLNKNTICIKVWIFKRFNFNQHYHDERNKLALFESPRKDYNEKQSLCLPSNWQNTMLFNTTFYNSILKNTLFLFYKL